MVGSLKTVAHTQFSHSMDCNCTRTSTGVGCTWHVTCKDIVNSKTADMRKYTTHHTTTKPGQITVEEVLFLSFSPLFAIAEKKQQQLVLNKFAIVSFSNKYILKEIKQIFARGWKGLRNISSTIKYHGTCSKIDYACMHAYGLLLV